jgi:hypothetical protein
LAAAAERASIMSGNPFLRFQRTAEAAGYPALLVVSAICLGMVVASVALLALAPGAFAFAIAVLNLAAAVTILSGAIFASLLDVGEPARARPPAKTRPPTAPGVTAVPRESRDEVTIRCHPYMPVALEEQDSWLEREAEAFRARTPQGSVCLSRLQEDRPSGDVSIGWLLELDFPKGELARERVAATLRDLRLLGLQPTIWLPTAGPGDR